jgi:hypothetical protein
MGLAEGSVSFQDRDWRPYNLGDIIPWLIDETWKGDTSSLHPWMYRLPAKTQSDSDNV